MARPHFAIRPNEVKTWIGLAILGIGTTLLFLPLQNFLTDFIVQNVGNEWYKFAIIGAIITGSAMFLFRVD